jgi:hypothetical protein
MIKLPKQLSNETYGEFVKRCNLPHVYVPYFPYGTEQVEWQVKLQQQFPVIFLYPYEALEVSKKNEMVYILFEDESHINEVAREYIIQYHCCMYGRKNAEAAVPSVEQLIARYRSELALTK